MFEIGRKARMASRHMAVTSRRDKDAALLSIADRIEQQADQLCAANQKDLSAGREKGLDAALLDRLELNQQGILSMAEGCRQVAAGASARGESGDGAEDQNVLDPEGRGSRIAIAPDVVER